MALKWLNFQKYHKKKARDWGFLPRNPIVCNTLELQQLAQQATQLTHFIKQKKSKKNTIGSSPPFS